MYKVLSITAEQWKQMPASMLASKDKLEKISKGYKPFLYSGNIKELDQMLYQMAKATLKEDSEKVDSATKRAQNQKTTSQSKKTTAKSGTVRSSSKKSTSRSRKTNKKSGKKNKVNPNAKGVELISLENKIIRRFVNLNGKIKTRNQIRLVINFIQKAIKEKRLTRAKTRYPDVINEIQTKLLDLFKRMGEQTKPIEINAKDLNKYLEILGEEYQMLSVRFIMSYLRLQGKEIEVEKVKRLYNRIAKAINNEKIPDCDKYMKELQVAMKSLKAFVEKEVDGGMLPIHQAELAGLQGVASKCDCSLNGLGSLGSCSNSAPKNVIMNSMDVVNLEFNKLGFKGKWLNFIGDPAPGFAMMVSAKPKYGKSYLCTEFAGYLARNHGTVLYVAREEGIDDTLQKKLKDKKVAHPDLDVSDYLPADMNDYEFVFLDSVTKLKLTPDDLESLRKRYPKISFIFVFQVTKNGVFRGANDYAHDVDSLIEIPVKGMAIQNGRFNQGGELEIFEETLAA